MEATTRTNLSKRIMQRVVAVYYLRKVLNRFVLKSGILVLGALAFGSLVHVAKVFENMPRITDVTAVTQFALQAFVNTEVAVQGVILALGIVTLWLARDILMTLISRTPSVNQYSHA